MSDMKEELLRKYRSGIESGDFDELADFETSNNKSGEASKSCSITKTETELNLFIVTPNNHSDNPKVEKLVRQMNKFTDEKFDAVKLSTSALPDKNSCATVLYKNTECKFTFTEDTVLINESNSTELNVGIKYRDSHYYLSGQDCRFPVEILFAVDEETDKMFQIYTDVGDKHKALKEYSKLTVSQRRFFKTQFNRPKKAETRDESIFTPIRDEKALRVLYETCKYTYSEATRAKINLLFSELDGYKSFGDKSNVINQLSHILGIDTQFHPFRKKTYDEIIALMNKHIYGLDEFKESFAEFLLAMQFSGCSNFAALIIGPPGVGKTSIGSIVSECCDKPLVYIDCSGADVIGMSGLVKSYSGAKAGKVIDGLWEIGRTDAVVLFDEIDKLSVTKEGNPYSVFLKALGPQKLLHDEYVDEDIDVSSSIFIATGNSIDDIPGYVVNRFGDNIFYFDKYSPDEKVAIAKNHLISSILTKHKIDKDELMFSDEALALIARDYCEDEGMREMEGYLKSLVRKVIRIWSDEQDINCIIIDESFVRKHLKKKVPYKESSRKMGF